MVEIEIGVLARQCLIDASTATPVYARPPPGETPQCRPRPHQVDVHNQKARLKTAPVPNPPHQAKPKDKTSGRALEQGR
jgi:hypothetical protein